MTAALIILSWLTIGALVVCGLWSFATKAPVLDDDEKMPGD